MKNIHLTMLGLMILFLGCSDSSIPTQTQLDSSKQLDSSINGKNVAYTSNQRFSLELDLEADAGYQWDYTISDTTVVRIDSTRYRPKSGNWNQIGGLTVETFYFYTKTAGNSTIDLIEHQGWVKDVPPIATVRFYVSVYR
jgi:predicted secreted protein